MNVPAELKYTKDHEWIKVEGDVRMTLSNTNTESTQKGTFINNTNTNSIAGETVTERSSLSKALRPKKPEADI